MNNLTYFGELKDAESDEDLKKVTLCLVQEWQLMSALVCHVLIILCHFTLRKHKLTYGDDVNLIAFGPDWVRSVTDSHLYSRPKQLPWL